MYNRTFVVTEESINRKWYIVDATGHTLGRLSTEVANVLSFLERSSVYFFKSEQFSLPYR